MEHTMTVTPIPPPITAKEQERTLQSHLLCFGEYQLGALSLNVRANVKHSDT